MIVFVGHPLAMDAPEGRRPAGTVALAAIVAASSGAAVQLVGKIGDDAPGDEIVLALGAAGVGHVAVLRDPARPTPISRETADAEDVVADQPGRATVEPADPDARPALEAADVDLGLRYLRDFRAVIVAEPLPQAVLRVAADAAGFAGAELVVVTRGEPPVELPATAVVLSGPTGDADEAFAALLGRMGAAIDGGQTAADALTATVADVGAVRAG